jgi:hypothetical protein
MTNTQPQIGRIALVQVNGNTVGYAQGCDVKESGKTVMEYVCQNSGGDWPAVSFSGNKSVKISIDALYVDSTYVNLLEEGSPITVINGPVGSSAGNPKDTYSAIVDDVDVSWKQDKIVTLKISATVTAQPTHGTW